MSTEDEVPEIELVAAAEALGWPANEQARAQALVALLAAARVRAHTEQMRGLRTGRCAMDDGPGRYVHHIDGDSSNNDLDNLMLVDPESNAGRGTQ